MAEARLKLADSEKNTEVERATVAALREEARKSKVEFAAKADDLCKGLTELVSMYGATACPYENEDGSVEKFFEWMQGTALSLGGVTSTNGDFSALMASRATAALVEKAGDGGLASAAMLEMPPVDSFRRVSSSAGRVARKVIKEFWAAGGYELATEKAREQVI